MLQQPLRGAGADIPSFWEGGELDVGGLYNPLETMIRGPVLSKV